MIRPALCLAIGSFAATPALAQTATVEVSHNDPDGLVEPGQTFKVRVDVLWGSSSILFAGLAGSVLPTPTTGQSSNITSVFEPGTWINLGTPSAGGVVGIDAVLAPNFVYSCYPWPPPAHGMLVDAFVAFDWTAPTDYQGPVLFNFTVPPGGGVRLYPATSSPAFVTAQTSYFSATVIVTPAPGSVLAGMPLLALVVRRNRR